MFVRYKSLAKFIILFIVLMIYADLTESRENHHRMLENYINLKDLLDGALPMQKVIDSLNNFNEIHNFCEERDDFKECNVIRIPKKYPYNEHKICKLIFTLENYEWKDPVFTDFGLDGIVATALSKSKTENKIFLNVFAFGGIFSKNSTSNNCVLLINNFQIAASMWRDNIKPIVITYQEFFEVFYINKDESGTSRIKVTDIDELTTDKIFSEYQLQNLDQIHSLPDLEENGYLVFSKEQKAMLMYYGTGQRRNSLISLYDLQVPDPDDVQVIISDTDWIVLSTSFVTKKSLLLMNDIYDEIQYRKIIEIH